MNFDTKARAQIRVSYRVARIIIIIHWTTCMFEYYTREHWITLYENLPKGVLKVPWSYNYWIPQVDMAHKTTEYYS